MADIYAFRGKYKEAAKYYQKAGQYQKALNMFTDLRMFDIAQVSLEILKSFHTANKLPLHNVLPILEKTYLTLILFFRDSRNTLALEIILTEKYYLEKKQSGQKISMNQELLLTCISLLVIQLMLLKLLEKTDGWISEFFILLLTKLLFDQSFLLGWRARLLSNLGI